MIRQYSKRCAKVLITYHFLHGNCPAVFLGQHAHIQLAIDCIFEACIKFYAISNLIRDQ